MLKEHTQELIRQNRERVLTAMQRREAAQHSNTKVPAATRAAARWFTHLPAQELLAMYRAGHFPIVKGGKA